MEWDRRHCSICEWSAQELLNQGAWPGRLLITPTAAAPVSTIPSRGQTPIPSRTSTVTIPVSVSIPISFAIAVPVLIPRPISIPNTTTAPWGTTSPPLAPVVPDPVSVPVSITVSVTITVYAMPVGPPVPVPVRGHISIDFVRLTSSLDVRGPVASWSVIYTRDRHALLPGFALSSEIGLSFPLSLFDFLLLPGLHLVLVQMGRRSCRRWS